MAKVYSAQTIYNFLAAAEQSAETIEQVANLSLPYPAGFLAGYRAALKMLTLAFGFEPPPIEVCCLEEIGDGTKT